MEEVRIQLTVLWIALMLTYLLGDVLRIFVGDFVAGEIEGVTISQAQSFISGRAGFQRDNNLVRMALVLK